MSLRRDCNSTATWRRDARRRERAAFASFARAAADARSYRPLRQKWQGGCVDLHDVEGPSFDHFERDDADARKPSFAGRAVKFVGVVFIVAAVVVFQQAADGPARSFAGGGWSTDWDAVEQASQSGKPSLVLFTADWCPGCRSFESDVLARADVREYLESRYTLVLVDVSRRDSPNQVLAKQCNIEVLPTLILYKRGIEVARSYGLSADELVKWLRSDGRAVRQFIER